MNLNGFVKKIVGNLPEGAEQAMEVIEFGGQFIPVAGSIMNTVRFKKIENELTKHEGKINAIGEKLDRSEHEVFFKQEVFPIVFNKILQDEQVEKTSIFLNGLEYIVDNEVVDEDIIFHYYDVLSELRLADIRHLAEKYESDLIYFGILKRRPTLRVPKIPVTKEEKKKNKEKVDVEQYMNNKLQRLGILQPGVRDKSLGVSPFGRRFVQFFYVEEEV